MKRLILVTTLLLILILQSLPPQTRYVAGQDGYPHIIETASYGGVYPLLVLDQYFYDLTSGVLMLHGMTNITMIQPTVWGLAITSPTLHGIYSLRGEALVLYSPSPQTTLLGIGRYGLAYLYDGYILVKQPGDDLLLQAPPEPVVEGSVGDVDGKVYVAMLGSSGTVYITSIYGVLDTGLVADTIATDGDMLYVAWKGELAIYMVANLLRGQLEIVRRLYITSPATEIMPSDDAVYISTRRGWILLDTTSGEQTFLGDVEPLLSGGYYIPSLDTTYIPYGDSYRAVPGRASIILTEDAVVTTYRGSSLLVSPLPQTVYVTQPFIGRYIPLDTTLDVYLELGVGVYLLPPGFLKDSVGRVVEIVDGAYYPPQTALPSPSSIERTIVIPPPQTPILSVEGVLWISSDGYSVMYQTGDGVYIYSGYGSPIRIVDGRYRMGYGGEDCIVLLDRGGNAYIYTRGGRHVATYPSVRADWLTCSGERLYTYRDGTLTIYSPEGVRSEATDVEMAIAGSWTTITRGVASVMDYSYSLPPDSFATGLGQGLVSYAYSGGVALVSFLDSEAYIHPMNTSNVSMTAPYRDGLAVLVNGRMLVYPLRALGYEGCRLSISATPRDADIYVSGTYVGRGSVETILPCNVEAVVRVERAGYKTYTETIRLTGDVELIVQLEPDYVSLNISVDTPSDTLVLLIGDEEVRIGNGDSIRLLRNVETTIRLVSDEPYRLCSPTTLRIAPTEDGRLEIECQYVAGVLIATTQYPVTLILDGEEYMLGAGEEKAIRLEEGTYQYRVLVGETETSLGEVEIRAGDIIYMDFTPQVSGTLIITGYQTEVQIMRGDETIAKTTPTDELELEPDTYTIIWGWGVEEVEVKPLETVAVEIPPPPETPSEEGAILDTGLWTGLGAVLIVIAVAVALILRRRRVTPSEEEVATI